MSTEQSLRIALDALDEGDRALVVLRHAHAMGYDELAEVFGAREGTIRMRLSRAIARMRDALDDDVAAEVVYEADVPASMPIARGVPVPAPFGAPPEGAQPAPAAPSARAPASWYGRLRGAIDGAREDVPSPAPVGSAPAAPALPRTLPRDLPPKTLHMRLEALVAAL